MSEYLQQALSSDKNDCVKRVICHLNSFDLGRAKMWDEKLIAKAVSQKINYTSPSMHLQVAVNVGQQGRPILPIKLPEFN